MRNRNIRNKLTSIYLIFGMVLLVIGFSYAFFIYNKTGLYTHTITGGKMKVIYDETTGNNILIENAYPRTDKEALTYGLEFEFTITGYNESEKNVYYAIEMDYGDDLNGKNRFLDTDIKLSLYKNDEAVFENEIFNNLDNQDIYYNYFKAGTSSQTPTVNNYKLRLWINDNVIISDTLSDDLNDWGNYEWDWLYESYPDKYDYIYNTDEPYLSDYGISIYTSDEFANSYANFKVNIKADLNYKDYDHLMYDPNGGTFDIDRSSLLTNMITTRKPVMENKGFLGWSSDPNATIPEYYSGDYYSGDGKLLYAVYSDIRNVMGDLNDFVDYYDSIEEVYFINDLQTNIDTYANEVLDNDGIVVDLTHEDYLNDGKVTGILDDGWLYIASEGTTYLTDCSDMFSVWENLYYIDFSNADTSIVEDMSYMFAGGYYDEENNWHSSLYNLTELNIDCFNTSNVTNMSYMFCNLCNLTELDVTYFDTTKVTDMSYMFALCEGIEYLDLSSFDTSNVTTMKGMFYTNTYWGALYKNIDLSSFDTSNVIDMSYMFYYCPGFNNLDLTNFDTSKVTDMSYMFQATKVGENIDISGFDTGAVTTMEGMFKYCRSEKLDLSHFDTSNVVNMSSMFYGADRFVSIGPGKEYGLNIAGFDTSKVTNMSSMFEELMNSIKILNIENFDTSNVRNMSCMFQRCNVTKLDLSMLDVSSVEDMSSMFYGSRKLVTAGPGSEYDLNIDNWITTSLVDMTYMFHGSNLETAFEYIDISHLNTSKVSSFSGLFAWLGNLKDVNLSNLDTSKVEDMTGMFQDCKSLIRLDLSHFDTSSLKKMGNGYYGGSEQPMFDTCTSLTYLDISSFNFSNIESYSYAFYGMPSNAKVYVGSTTDQNLVLAVRSSWTTSNVIVKTV